MHVFHLFACLVVTTVMARPEPPVFMGLQHQNQRSLSLNGHNAKPLVYQQLPQEQHYTNFVANPSHYSALADSISADILAPANPEDSYKAAYHHSSSQHHQSGYENGPTETQVHKHIYVHVPPKDFEEEDAIKPRVTHQVGRKQKHYKIVFIKAPEAPVMHMASAPPMPQNEEKTLIYVLHKKPESQPDIVIPTPEPTKPSKPEVYFIKYKTRRDEAPVYGPPPAFSEINLRQSNEADSIDDHNNSVPKDLGQYEMEATTQQPHYQEEEQQQFQSKFAPQEEVSNAEAEFNNAPTISNFLNDKIQATSTVEPLNQYLPPETTLAPIVVKEMEVPVHVPSSSYGAPQRNRFFIKRRK